MKKGDFIQINYTARTKEGNEVFDTTLESVAHETGLEHQHGTMKPVTLCIGEGHVLPGLDKQLEGKAIGKYHLEIPVEEAFGKKDAKLMRLIPMKLFTKEEIRPMPGMPITVDNTQGTVRAVSGGRVIVDFNHPLAGQDLTYDIEVIKEVHDKKEQVESVLAIRQFPVERIEIKEGHAEVVIGFDVPQEVGQIVSDEIKRLVKLESVTFKVERKEKPASAQNDSGDGAETAHNHHA